MYPTNILKAYDLNITDISLGRAPKRLSRFLIFFPASSLHNQSSDIYLALFRSVFPNLFWFAAK